MCVLSQALVCLDAVVSQKCADWLLLAALEFLCSLGKIFVPPDSQVIKDFLQMMILILVYLSFYCFFSLLLLLIVAPKAVSLQDR